MVLPSLLAYREGLECNGATVVSCRLNWLGHHNQQKRWEASPWDAFYEVTHLFSPCLWDHEHCKEYFRLKQVKQNPGWCFSKWLAMELTANLLQKITLPTSISSWGSSRWIFHEDCTASSQEFLISSQNTDSCHSLIACTVNSFKINFQPLSLQDNVCFFLNLSKDVLPAYSLL